VVADKFWYAKSVVTDRFGYAKSVAAYFGTSEHLGTPQEPPDTTLHFAFKESYLLDNFKSLFLDITKI
jgi:hypothetical protein